MTEYTPRLRGKTLTEREAWLVQMATDDERERIIALLQPIADECDNGECNRTSYSDVIHKIREASK